MVQPKVFVSHSHQDDAFTDKLVADLRLSGADAWMDTTDLGAGNFQQRISEALAGCEWFVLVLSQDALASPWVRQEVDAANWLKNRGQVHDLIFVQAGPCEHWELPPLWRVFNIFDATRDYAAALDRTLRAMGLSSATSGTATSLTPPPATPPPSVATLPTDQFPARLTELGFTVRSDHGVAVIVPPLCRVPAGPFLMGSNPKRDAGAYIDEQPQQTVTLPTYELARYPVTVVEYECFVRAGHAVPNDWQTQLDNLDHPVVNVTWHDAVAYAAWLSERTGEQWRLASEAEWEKAARGTDGRVYPWGDSFDTTRCNTSEGARHGTTPVGTYPTGASPYGAEDMAGNVWEWTGSLRASYPYTLSGKREDPNSTSNRVLRGGSWNDNARLARVAFRGIVRPASVIVFNGFRLVRTAHSV